MALGALQEPSGRLATTTPLPMRPEPRKPALRMVMTARPFALDRIEGGMTLSGPKACPGLINEERILPHFLHSAAERHLVSAKLSRGRAAPGAGGRRTLDGRGERIIEAEAHLGAGNGLVSLTGVAEQSSEKC